MTANELEFFGRLVAALPDYYIFPQVALSALLDAASPDKKTAHGDRLRIAQQRADFVVCTKSGELLAVVELDDKTHTRAKDQLRDALFVAVVGPANTPTPTVAASARNAQQA